MNQETEFRTSGSSPTMNVSKTADAEFMCSLEIEDPARYERLMRNIRRDSPNMGMSEEQALTNWQLGLPTGQWRFAVVAGQGAPISKLRADADRLLHEGTADEYAMALCAIAEDSEPVLIPTTASPRQGGVYLSALAATAEVAPTKGTATASRKMRARMKQARAGRKAAASRSRAKNGVFSQPTRFLGGLGC